MTDIGEDLEEGNKIRVFEMPKKKKKVKKVRKKRKAKKDKKGNNNDPIFLDTSYWQHTEQDGRLGQHFKLNLGIMNMSKEIQMMRLDIIRIW